MTLYQFFMFHDFSMTTFIFQVFWELWELCVTSNHVFQLYQTNFVTFGKG